MNNLLPKSQNFELDQLCSAFHTTPLASGDDIEAAGAADTFVVVVPFDADVMSMETSGRGAGLLLLMEGIKSTEESSGSE